ncbi:MAG: N-acetylmuramoyl-L-alanine amidase, partial [bacterium]
VLKNFDMPAILIECGFLTNNEEAGYLNDSAYQQRLAIAIFNGINLYLAERDPSFQPYQYPLD